MESNLVAEQRLAGATEAVLKILEEKSIIEKVYLHLWNLEFETWGQSELIEYMISLLDEGTPNLDDEDKEDIARDIAEFLVDELEEKWEDFLNRWKEEVNNQ